MSIRIEAGAEPIPGYQLISWLGAGGYGEVWKAMAPGGLLKAIKFVPGQDKARQTIAFKPVLQELSALQRVQGIRHPFLLSLERYDVVGDQLIVVTELADRDLKSLLDECRARGLPGIPRDELLRYLEEAAEALDLMNVQHGLQHLDIKPANLFLVQSHVKVADFGLARDLEALKAGDLGGATPCYTAPERYKGGLSRYCDQYSLAIAYQEMLTGTVPFHGKTLIEWRDQHFQTAPDVTPLPSFERVLVAQALSKKPSGRFASCLDLIRALRHADRPELLPKVLSPQSWERLPSLSDLAAIECPACKWKSAVPSAFRGQPFVCRNCTRPFTIPAPKPLDIPEEIALAPEGDPAKEAEPEIYVDSTCPKCSHTFSAPERLVGKKVRCVKCKHVFVLSRPAGPEKKVKEQKAVGKQVPPKKKI